MNKNFIQLVRELAKGGHDVVLEANTHDVVIYDKLENEVAWISGSMQDSFIVYDVEAISGFENKAIEAYAGLPVGERV
ncbi:hypothetical protein lacNasYZ03_05570 [Lactobacillus nasalidis]|uniref:Uncharacterized protein n=1 Tax=Lactobacillus nasalidis TaxID=2797258 RepID=A0ABQ3W697_9LACO|nr:hypothetical protein [Lactobacillus nasalidis]GHW00870.1 hypothetical protein lacNasYZ03_05570 [Lactobacillus nasalidis]